MTSAWALEPHTLLPASDDITVVVVAALILGGILILFAKIAQTLVRIALALALVIAAALLAIATRDNDGGQQNRHESMQVQVR